ncbi:MAG: 1-phosphofructokinase family hexose kinase [Gaiellales bacterium]
MIACIAANPSIDRLFAVDRLVPGQIHRPADFVQVPGGKGLNVARAAVCLGGVVTAVALLGGHAGRWIAQELEAEGVSLRAAWAEPETRSSLSVAGSSEGLTEFYEHGAPVSEEEWDGFARLAVEVASGADWTTVSGSLPPGAPAGGYLPLLAASRIAFDSLEAGFDAGPAVVKLNAAEAGRATGREITDAAGAANAARDLREMTGGGGAIVTRGLDGAVLVTPAGDVLAGRVDADGAYPVGSGDAFLAGLVVTLDSGADWPAAMAAALGAGAANAEQPGAGMLRRERAEELAARAVMQAL